MIDFNRPPVLGTETGFFEKALANGKLCGDGPFTAHASKWFKDRFSVKHCYLTTSCTSALEMASWLCDLEPGDEVIMPSYTFVSTADAFVLRGAKIVFVDIDPKTMNIDPEKIEEAVTGRTKVICPVHYAGVACDMDPILQIAGKHGLKVVEDAAQGVNAFYKGRPLGTIGDYGCWSFHETKNYSMGEGGALLFNNDADQERAEIVREKGTDRSKFFRGQIDKYSWVGYGSSYLPSELNAAYLCAQLEQFDEINNRRLAIWNYYDESLRPLADAGLIEQPYVPDYAQHNAHMYYIKAKDLEARTKLISYLREQGAWSVFHYVPLHSSKAGMQFGRFHGEDVYTTKESERLMRLPLFYNLKDEEMEHIVRSLLNYPDWN
jgi:dTDP-4-amino-4,6-dideoxygalactose transaminase